MAVRRLQLMLLSPQAPVLRVSAGTEFDVVAWVCATGLPSCEAQVLFDDQVIEELNGQARQWVEPDGQEVRWEMLARAETMSPSEVTVEANGDGIHQLARFHVEVKG